MSYELYSDVYVIAKSMVVHSKGLGYQSFNKSIIMGDVERAERVVDIAKKYWAAMSAESKVREKVRAARVLELDDIEYIALLEQRSREKDALVEKMQAIVDSCNKRYDGKWDTSQVVIPE